MKKRFLILTILVLAIAIFVNGCTSSKSNTVTDEPVEIKAVVKTAMVQKKSVERTIEHTSSLTPYEEVHFSPAAPGRIESLKVNIGDNVTKGTLIAVMDQTQFNQARVQLANLATDFSRFDTLIKTGSIPQQQYDQIKTQYEVAKTNYDFLQRNTHLRAPFTGIISGKYYEEGEMYSGAPNAQVGKAAIVSIVQINPIKAVVNVSERYFPSVQKGMKADVVSDIYSGEKFTGEVVRIHPVIDQATRTFQVEVKIDNAQEKLRPGMFTRVSLHFGMDQALLVPSGAVMKQTGTNIRYAYVNKNNVAEMRTVTIGRLHDDMVEILNGLQEGEDLVIVGQNKLVNQMALEVVQ
jgi:membrane fusion protein, multidrug efflux system